MVFRQCHCVAELHFRKRKGGWEREHGQALTCAPEAGETCWLTIFHICRAEQAHRGNLTARFLLGAGPPRVWSPLAFWLRWTLQVPHPPISGAQGPWICWMIANGHDATGVESFGVWLPLIFFCVLRSPAEESIPGNHRITQKAGWARELLPGLCLCPEAG